jgi:hypothetical protein
MTGPTGDLINKLTLDLTISNDLKKLTDNDAYQHINNLKNMLGLMSRLMVEKMPEVGGQNEKLQQYIQRLQTGLDLILLRDKIEALGANADIKQECGIDPSESGYPVVMRDFYMLEQEKPSAQEQLAALPSKQDLVGRAEYVLCRGIWPKDNIVDYVKRDYFEKLIATDIPVLMRLLPLEVVKQTDDGKFKLKQYVEMLDKYNNLPHFYTFYLEVPEQSIKKPEWQQELFQIIPQTIEGIIGNELPTLARKVEDIEGVQVKIIERFDLGPFYTKFTENSPVISELIQGRDYSLLGYSRSFIQRIGETERTGMGEKWKATWSGDRLIGDFSPAVDSPLYMLMPFILIQEATNRKLNLGNVQMYGIDNKGDILA